MLVAYFLIHHKSADLRWQVSKIRVLDMTKQKEKTAIKQARLSYYV